MVMEPAADIKVGTLVFGQDGLQIGRVKEVTPNSIKIDAPLRPDYWIERTHVVSFNADRVTVDFNGDLLDRFASSIPPAADRS
jgi:FKBP-type peptidyl-prolyl cis-trans isomerase 2